MKKVYISGPMTGLPEYNYPAFHEAAHKLREAGYEPINPADFPIQEDWEWADYMRQDIPRLCEADHIYLLDGWENSKGATVEKSIADILGITSLSDQDIQGQTLKKLVENLTHVAQRCADEDPRWSSDDDDNEDILER